MSVDVSQLEAAVAYGPRNDAISVAQVEVAVVYVPSETRRVHTCVY